MVFKPSELTNFSACRLAELLIEAGLPPGVVNVVLGDADVGSKLTSHPLVAKVSLTGRLQTGFVVVESLPDQLSISCVNRKRVLAAASSTLVRLSL